MPRTDMLITGVIDTDSDDRYIEKGDYRYALNCRCVITKNSSTGTIENTDGSTVKDFPLPDGYNEVVGSYGDDLNNVAIFLVYNSNNEHLILEYDKKEDSVNKVLQSNFLNFFRGRVIFDIHRITDINNDMLYWNDTGDKPHKIDYQKAKNIGDPWAFDDNTFINGFVGFVSSTAHNLEVGDEIRILQDAGFVNEEYETYAYVTEIVSLTTIKTNIPWATSTPANPGQIYKATDYDFLTNMQSVDFIQWAPNKPPKAEYRSYPNKSSNNVFQKLFQFRYRFIYENGERSALSPISKLPTPVIDYLLTQQNISQTSEENGIRVFFDTGSPFVKHIEILFREGNFDDFRIFKRIEKKRERFHSESVFFVDFFNEESTLPVSLRVANQNFDNVPLQAGAFTMIDKSRSAFGDILEGRDNIDLDVSAKIVNTPITTGSNRSIRSTFRKDNYPSATNKKIEIIDGTQIISSSTDLQYQGIYSSYSVYPVNDLENKLGGISVGDKIEISLRLQTRGQDNIVINLDTGGTATYNESPKTKNYNPSPYVIKPGDTIQDAINTLLSFIPSTDTNFPQASIPFVGNNHNIQTNINFSFANGDLSLSVQSINWTKAQIDPLLPGSVEDDWKLWGAYGINRASLVIKKVAGSSPEKSFKKGANHKLALAYYDNPNRNGLAQVDDNLDIDIPVGLEGAIGLDILINHQAPEWANYYQVLYKGNDTIQSIPSGFPGFFQLNGSGCSSGINSDGTWCLFAKISEFKDANPGNIMSYDFAEGDRLRLLKVNGNPVTDNVESEIIRVNLTPSSGQWIFAVRPLEGYSFSDMSDILIEVYRPKTVSQNEDFSIYYEIGECMEIEDGLHKGNEEGDDQTQNTPAIVRLRDQGDVYIRPRLMGSLDTEIIEDYHYSDYFRSNFWNRGRGNSPDSMFKQTRRIAGIVHSDRYIPDTNINGISTFFDDAIEGYDVSHGNIRRMFSKQGSLIVFQRLRTGKLGIGEQQLFDSQGQNVGAVGQSGFVLPPKIVYYSSEYGIGDFPESMASYGNDIYHVDPVNGTVVALNMHNGYREINTKNVGFFSGLFKKINSSKDSYNIIGTYDTDFKEYIISLISSNYILQTEEGRLPGQGTTKVSKVKGDIDEFTFSYSSLKKGWITFYGFLLESFACLTNDLVLFRDGKIHVLTDSAPKNNFFGEQQSSIIELVHNEAMQANKVYQNIDLKSTTPWRVLATNQYGQRTSLIEDDYSPEEGVWKASFWMDENTPNIQTPLIEGDPMRCHSMNIRLENSSEERERLALALIRFIFSESTTK